LVMGPRLCKVQAAEKKPNMARVVCPHVYSCKGNATMLSQVLVMSVETFASNGQIAGTSCYSNYRGPGETLDAAGKHV
jgi:hypothetical protein